MIDISVIKIVLKCHIQDFKPGIAAIIGYFIDGVLPEVGWVQGIVRNKAIRVLPIQHLHPPVKGHGIGGLEDDNPPFLQESFQKFQNPQRGGMQMLNHLGKQHHFIFRQILAPFFRILGIVQVKIKVNSKYLTPLLPFIIDIPERFTYHIFICATVSHKHKKRRLSWPDHYPVSQPVWMQTPKAF